MTINDPISDMLARIRNGLMRGKPTVSTPASLMRIRVLEVLVSEGYIRTFKVEETEGAHRSIVIELKYHDGEPAIRTLRRVSRSGRRVYSAIGDLRPVAGGVGVAIVSTSKGVLPDWRAREENVGGEVLCTVF